MKNLKCTFIAIFAVFLMFLLAGCGTTPDPVDPAVSSLLTNEQFTDLEEKLAENPTSPPRQNFLMNEPFEIEDFVIEVVSYQIIDKISDSSGFWSYSPDNGEKYIKIDMKVTNNGANSQTLVNYWYGNDDTLIFDDKYNYGSSVLIMADDDLNDKSIKPLSTANGFLAYKVPEAVYNSDKSLVWEITIDNQVAKVTIR